MPQLPSSEPRSTLSWRLLLAALAGLLQAWSIAWPWSTPSAWQGQALGWLQVASVALLVAVLARARSAAQACAQAWVFAAVWLGATFWWLFISMHTYGGLNAVLAAAAVAALAGALASVYGVAAALWFGLCAQPEARLGPAVGALAPAGALSENAERTSEGSVPASPNKPPASLLSFPALKTWFYQEKRPIVQYWRLKFAIYFACLWLLAELARAAWFTGFPWGAGGYAHINGLAPWLAPWLGVFGLGAVASAVAALQVAWTQPTVLRRSVLRAAGAGTSSTAASPARSTLQPVWARVAAATALSLFAALSLEPPAPGANPRAGVSVALLQGNIPQEEKFEPSRGIEQALRWYGEQLQRSTATFVAGPETAIPILPRQLPDGYLSAITQRFGAPGSTQAAMLGIPLGDYERGYTNSVVAFAPGQVSPDALFQYSKHHLVPFGEFIPPFFKWFTKLMNIPLGDFNRGALAQPSLAWAGERWAPNICYEDLFGEELAQRFVDPARAPTVMVNISNIGWFGNSVAIDQHLSISRMRALELARPMLRATNTGATAIIDANGQVTDALPRYTLGVLHGEVFGQHRITAYAYWAGRWGHWPLWLLACGVLGWALRARRAHP